MSGVNAPKFRVSYQILDFTNQLEDKNNLHCFAVNAFDVDETKKRLYTAGRDSTVKCWDISSQNDINYLYSLENHSNWVNDVVLCSSDILATCSSDATVKLWNINEEQAEEQTTISQLQENSSGELISETDSKQEDEETTSKVKSRVICTFEGHSDYVMKLVYSKENNLLASGGLDKRIMLWDIEQGIALNSLNLFNDNSIFEKKRDYSYLRNTIDESKGSIYAMTMADNGNLLLFGGTEKIIKGWDIRSPNIAFKLKGHHDIIRSLKGDSQKIASSSSDGAIKIWDMGMQRCFKTYTIHDDSVWCLDVDRSFSKLFSAGRDRNVYYTDLLEGDSTLLLQSGSPIIALHLAEDETSVWISTSANGVHNYHLDDKFSEKRSISENHDIQYSSSPMSGRASFPKSSPLMYQIKDQEKQREIELNSNYLQSKWNESEESMSIPRYSSPSRSLSTKPGIIKYHILNDRVHVLTKDNTGFISLWNICENKKEKDIGVVDWDDQISEHCYQVSIPTWFSLDAKIGSLTVHLDPSQCFNAEIDPTEIGLPAGNQMNIGARVLCTLFQNWVITREAYIKSRQEYWNSLQKIREFQNEQLKQSANDSESQTPKSSNDSSTSPHDNNNNNNQNNNQNSDNKSNADDNNNNKRDQTNNNNNSAERKKEESNEQSKKPINNAPIVERQSIDNPVFPMPPSTPVIISNFHTGLTYMKSTIEEIDHSVALPLWVSDCIFKSKYVSREKNKIFFYLQPSPGEKLPALPEGTAQLGAFRALKASRVANHLVRNLKLVTPLDLNPPETESAEEVRIKPEDYLEIICKGTVVDNNTNLATMKAFIWKSSDIMCLHYRRRNEFQNLPIVTTSQSSSQSSSRTNNNNKK